MGKNADFVSHKKSKQKNQDGSPKLPVASALVEGEIAINFAENVETLSIKNESGDVVTFSSDNYYTEKKLGSGFTGENSGVTVTDTILWVSGTGENAIVQKGGGNTASGKLSVAMGSGTTASGDYSVTEGRITTASGDYSHAEGYNTKANGISSHAEGASTTASGPQSHAEGGNTKANGQYSHAEGNSTSATSQSSHAEGNYTKANGQYSHAEGSDTTASGDASHAEGRYTEAKNTSEHASGRYNVSSKANNTFGNSGNTLFSVGNGTADNARHNAFEIRQNGDIYITSGSSDIKLQDYIGSPIDVDQVLDDTTSASTNPVSSKAVYKAATDNELVWTNAFVAMSGTVSAHTANTEIHVTAADKTAWVNKIGYAEYDSNDKKINFYKNDTDTATSICYIDATDFIKDGMVQNVEIKDVTSGGSQVTCLVISFNTDAGKQDINVPISDIFDASNYYTKSQTSGATEISNALTGLDARKLDVSAYTPSVELWEAGSGSNAVVLKNSSGTAVGNFSVAEGKVASATSYHSHAEGYGTLASGGESHAEGAYSKAIGSQSHAEGMNTQSLGDVSHAEGNSTTASSIYSHAEGDSTVASGTRSHAEGYYSKASGNYGSHAEGQSTTASGDYSHAEGYGTTASGNDSHAEGYGTTASSYCSHAEGDSTVASGYSSHAEGRYTEAKNVSEHASGQYNVSNSASTTFGDSGNTLFSVGNGSADDARHNAFEIRQNGDIYIASGNSDIKLQDYIGGSVETVTAITPSNSGSTSPIATKVVAENELTVSNALIDLDERKLDASAYTPTDLSNYYTKSETSGATELSTAFGTVNASIEDLSGQSETVAAALNDLHTNKLDVSAYTPTDLSNYYTKDETSGATELQTALSNKADKTAVDDLSGQSETVAVALNELNDRISQLEEMLKNLNNN